MKCPRRPYDPNGVYQLPDEDTWRDDGTCSYCGSLNPDTLMARAESGEFELGPTDKGYKVYVKVLSGPKLKQTWRDCPRDDMSDRSALKLLIEKGRLVVGKKDADSIAELQAALARMPCVMGPDECTHWTTREVDHGKFYFMHLSEEQMRRFVDLYNAKTMKIGYPGHFYALPYFMKAAQG